jgi:diacylglycerol kinase (ATP)
MEYKMINNKPKYHLFKNTKYALDGLIHAFKTESSFKLELLAGVIIVPIIFFTPFEVSQKLILFSTAILVLIVELINSAIENVVDLVTLDIHPLAKNAKDIGATAVMFSIILHIICWGAILIS